MRERFGRLLRFYVRLQFLQIRIYFEYRADFWIGIFGMLLTQGTGLVFIWVLFQRVPTVGGWSVWEIALLYALAIIPRGLTDFLFNGQWQLRQLVNTGEFDRLLLRPLSPALQVITQACGIQGIGSVALGIVVLVTALQKLNLSWGWWQDGFLLATTVSAVLLISSIDLATNCIAFWDPSASSAFPFSIQYCIEFAKYPVTLYGRLIQIFITWILPFAFVSYYPGLVLLNKAGNLLWPEYVTLLIGPLMALLCAAIWRYGLARYQGVGH